MTDSDHDSNRKIPRFHGRKSDEYAVWRLRLRAVCQTKGPWNVVCADSKVDNSDKADDDTKKDDTSKKEKASTIIISALGDSPCVLLHIWMMNQDRC